MEFRQLLLFFSGLVAISLLHFFTGYADNGDYLRSVDFIFQKPEGFSKMWPTPGTEEWSRRFFDYWHDTWVFRTEWPDFDRFFNFSSYKGYLFLQVMITQAFSHDSTLYSVMAGSVLSRVILLGSFLFLLIYLNKTVGIWAFLAFFISASLLIVDSSWIAFLNSFSEEQVAVIFIPLMAFAAIRFYLSFKPLWAVILSLTAIFIGASKLAFSYLPGLTLLFMIPKLRSWPARISVSVILVGAQAMLLINATHEDMTNVNKYHALYFGALRTLSEEEVGQLDLINGKPIQTDCIGVKGFGQQGRECRDSSQSTYTDTAALVLQKPIVAYRMLKESFQQGRTIDLEYLGKSRERGLSFADSAFFNVYSTLFSFSLPVFYLLFLGSLMSFRLFRPKYFDSYLNALLYIGVLMAAFGYIQYPVALADGFYEMSKHLMIGNYALAWSFCFVVSVVVQLMINSFHKCREYRSRVPESDHPLTHHSVVTDENTTSSV